MSESVPRDRERDPVVEAYKAGVDRTLIRERLARTPAERAEDLVALARFAEELRKAGDEPGARRDGLAGLIRALADGGVECILVGGVAATIHGSARLTRDVDIVYSRRPENLARLVTALGPFEPYLRGAPRGLPFHWDDDTVARGLNFPLTTTLGDIDLLGEITGGGGFDDQRPHAHAVHVLDREMLCRC